MSDLSALGMIFPRLFGLLLAEAVEAVLLSLLSECLFLRGQGSCEEVLEEGYALPGMMDSVGWD